MPSTAKDEPKIFRSPVTDKRDRVGYRGPPLPRARDGPASWPTTLLGLTMASKLGSRIGLGCRLGDAAPTIGSATGSAIGSSDGLDQALGYDRRGSDALRARHGHAAWRGAQEPPRPASRRRSGPARWSLRTAQRDGRAVLRSPRERPRMPTRGARRTPSTVLAGLPAERRHPAPPPHSIKQTRGEPDSITQRDSEYYETRTECEPSVNSQGRSVHSQEHDGVS